MIYKVGNPLYGSDLTDTAPITKDDIQHAKDTGYERLPRLRPAFDAVLIDPKLDPGPIAEG